MKDLNGKTIIVTGAGDGIGRVLRRTSNFVIMEKLGLAGAIAEEHDPRSAEIEDTG